MTRLSNRNVTFLSSTTSSVAPEAGHRGSNPPPVSRYGGDVVEARVGAGPSSRRRRRAPARVRSRGRRPQRRLRPLLGRVGAARRRVHIRGGLLRARLLLLRRRAALPLRQPPRARQPRAARALPPPGRRDFAPHRQLLLFRPVFFWWVHGGVRREEICSEVTSGVRRQQLVHSDRLHPGPGVPEWQAREPVLEARRVLVVLGALRLRVRGQQLRDQDDELQGQGRAGGVQPRDPARLLRHGQARGRAQLVVRGVQAPAVLPVRALLQPQGLAHQPVQQLFLEARARCQWCYLPRRSARLVVLCSTVVIEYYMLSEYSYSSLSDDRRNMYVYNGYRISPMYVQFLYATWASAQS